MGRKRLVAALAATALGASPLLVAAPAAAIMPAESLTAGGYGGYSTGSNIHVEALTADPGTLANLSLAQSAAGVGVGRELVDQDLLESAILFADQTGKNAYGHGSAVNVGVGQDESDVPQIAPSTAEALSPPPTVAEPTELLSLPAELAPLAQAQLLPSTAQALTTSLTNVCPGTGSLISEGTAEVANVQLLSPGEGQQLVTVGTTATTQGVSDTESQVLVDPATGALTTVTTQTIAPVTLFEGILDAQVDIDVLYRLQLRATATGGSGSSIFYGFVREDGTPVPDSEPVLTINGEGLTTEDLFGGEGVQLSLGVADVFIGAPAYGLVDDPTTDPTVTPTTVAGAADLIRVRIPGTVATGTTTPVAEDSPLAPVLNPVLQPVVEGLEPVLTAIQEGLAEAGLDVVDLRIGHLEAQSTVPVGGIVCLSAGPDDPFALAAKDVSANSVAPGATFEYTVRFQNTAAEPVTNVRVVDVFSGGPPELEFVESDPPPTSRDGSTLTYDVGTVEPGQYVDISLTFRVPADAAPGTVYRNQATITGTFQGREVSRVVNVEGPTVISTPTGDCDVSRSTKYASHLQVRTGDQFAYYVNVSNTGGQACTGVTVTDTLGAGVEYVACSDDCTRQDRTVTWDIGTLQPGASTTVSVTVRVTATDGTLPNRAEISTTEGSRAQPSTPGPRVTDEREFAPGNPAGCPSTGCPDVVAAQPNRQLPRTGPAALLPALGALALGGAFAALRRRGDAGL